MKEERSDSGATYERSAASEDTLTGRVLRRSTRTFSSGGAHRRRHDFEAPWKEDLRRHRQASEMSDWISRGPHKWCPLSLSTSLLSTKVHIHHSDPCGAFRATASRRIIQWVFTYDPGSQIARSSCVFTLRWVLSRRLRRTLSVQRRGHAEREEWGACVRGV